MSFHHTCGAFRSSIIPWLGVTLLLIPTAALGGAGDGRTEYQLRASVALTAPQIDGTVVVTFTNTSRRTLDEAVFILFPNRFATPDKTVDDFNRPFIYPEEDFDSGSMKILAARDGDTPAAVEPMPSPDLFASAQLTGCFVRIPIAPLQPGGTRTITLRFQTVVPYRFGSFGAFEQQLTAVGGWYPYLAARDDGGTWQLDAPPPLADFDVHLIMPPELELVLNGAHFARQPSVNVRVPAVHYLALVAAPQLLRDETTVDNIRILFFHRPARWTSRINPEASPTEIMLDTLRDILTRRPPGLPQPPEQVVVVEAPLRLNLTDAGEGMIVVSDRSLKVHWLLRPFHELQLAQSLYAELLRPALAMREPDADYGWVSEGLSRMLAARFVAQARPGTRSVQDWIELFNIFAIVDRFESAPKIPFVDAFFDRARVSDPLHAHIGTFNNVLPPGRAILGKLRQEVGQETFDATIDRCAAATLPFRRCAAATAGRDLDWLFKEWLQAYPALNYRFESVRLNEPASDKFRQTVAVRRESSRPIIEPVTVRLRSIGGRFVDIRWNGRGDAAELSAETSERMWQALIDPDRALIEDQRDDDASPPTPQVVLDSAEVEISSTEFGFSALMVGHGRYDYRKDLAVAGFYTNRGVGFTAGARGHWGEPVDATTYRHNLYGFYGAEALDGSFTEKRRPGAHTRGQLRWLGARYDYSNVFSFDNPTDERHLRLYADWYDRGLGSDFNYTDWGASVALTHPLWSYRSVAALQVLDGFSEPLGSGVVPNQGLYSLGGSLSIRGIGAEEELGRNIFLVRTELRQDVYPELDLNFLDLLVMRRLQVRLFADSGRVSNSAGRVYDVSGYAVGVGTGLAGVYDFLGFFPSVAYIEIATRVDDARKVSDVQFLFGTRQAF